ncbi:MAG: helicase-related protein [Bacillus sp. (in: firmicutes)]
MNIQQIEAAILAGLKDFQRATVNRVSELFINDYSRVLVADEVGLGKTLIGRGVIAKMARYHREVLQDNLFKVIYVCSNQSIAGQNLAKLKIDPNVTVENSTDTRLSMQHLKIFESRHDTKLKNNYIQLIPLTPSTSFNMTSGAGSVRERALMFAILRKHPAFRHCLPELEKLLIDCAIKGWNKHASEFQALVEKCDQDNAGDYLKTMMDKIDFYFDENKILVQEILNICSDILQSDDTPQKRNRVIYRLRKMMAEISVDLIRPDLVIMDEFQRFPELIHSDGDSETAILAKKFFNIHQENEEKVKILLLSATPYKLYSTLEEINEQQEDSHYKEFMQVTNFLFQNHVEQQNQFQTVWKDYSVSLGQVTSGNLAVIMAKKSEAEDLLYKGIVRTERSAINGAEDLIDVSNRNGRLSIAEEDILSYVQMDYLLKDIGLHENVPVEYIKSAPYILSFMDHYKLKEKISDYFKENRNEINKAKYPKLWVNRAVINKYGDLPITNARLKNLQENALPNGAEKLMWVPPSLPYYEFGGCYKNQDHFSKVLVFSAWEMVPRSIATLVSYEAEKRTVGRLIARTAKSKKKKRKKQADNRTYFAQRRFPAPRLTFTIRDHNPANMNFLCLFYPSAALAKLFNPIEALNDKCSLLEWKLRIQQKINKLLSQVQYTAKEENGREDQRWYYMAPLLFDLQEETVRNWLESPQIIEGKPGEVLDDQGALSKHFERLKELYFSEERPVLGKQPDDLVEVLTDMTLGSPAVCALRMLGISVSQSSKQAVAIAKTIVDRFNGQEAISAVELQYGSGKEEGAHWQNVLKYCVDGNIQAMLDEYAHILSEGVDLSGDDREAVNRILTDAITDSLKAHTASYNVDTFNAFKNRISKSKKPNKDTKDNYIKMRTNYAVGFYDIKSDDKSIQRKDNIRLAFNSPFRPFVLASTSIGQEGLDFHHYCRKIVHWNLPSNPIDLEQREGRINRYKCLAIRKNIAEKYQNITFEKDIWNEMFTAASQQEKSSGTCELIPFWCLPGNQPYKVERIIPSYPLSRDGNKYERLIKILSLYRLSLGQAHQEDLLNYLFDNGLTAEELKGLFMNLSPYYKGEGSLEE